MTTRKETAQFIEDFKKHVQKKFPNVKSVPTRRIIEEHFGITRQAVFPIMHWLYTNGILKRKRDAGKNDSHTMELVDGWKSKFDKK